jgi:hypothetical protein
MLFFHLVDEHVGDFLNVSIFFVRRFRGWRKLQGGLCRLIRGSSDGSCWIGGLRLLSLRQRNSSDSRMARCDMTLESMKGEDTELDPQGEALLSGMIGTA